MSTGISQPTSSFEQHEFVYASSWRQWCRLCAKEDSQGNITIFLKDEQQESDSGAAVMLQSRNTPSCLVAAIERFFWVSIKRNENLPEMLCTECFSLLTTLVNFAERVAKVQKMFEDIQNIQNFSVNEQVDFHELRVKYALLNDERDLLPFQHVLPETHYIEDKLKVAEMGERAIQVDSSNNDPLAQTLKYHSIKTETVVCKGEKADEAVFISYGHHPLVSDNVGTEPDAQSDEEQEIKTNPRLKDAKPHISECQQWRKLVKSEGQPKKRRPPNIKNKSTKKVNSETGPISCTECPRKFQHQHHYRRHMKLVHAKIEPTHKLQCPQCSLSFTTQWKFERHAKVHVPLELKKVIPCPHCEKKFSSDLSLQTHIKYIHMDERPFVCEECGEAVHTNTDLKQHMARHTDYAPFECEVCKKSYKTQLLLKKHMLTHDPHKPICPECGLQLSGRATLIRHLLVHSDQMEHKCDYCGRAFKRAKTLKNHLLLHTGLKPYSCNFCDRTFASGSNCRSHKKKAHPEELAALEAAGGGRTFTRNIPKLKTLKAVTKAAENLKPVVSKQSGNFANKKSKLATEAKGSAISASPSI